MNARRGLLAFWVILTAWLCGSGCVKYKYHLTLFPDGSGKIRMDMRFRKDMDPLRQTVDELEILIRQARVGARNEKIIGEKIKLAIQKSFVESLEEHFEGIHAWKTPKYKRKKNSTSYDLTGYFHDVNHVKIFADESGDNKTDFEFERLDDDTYELRFTDTTTNTGFDRFDEGDFEEFADDVPLEKVLSGMEMQFTFRMPGKVIEAEGMKINMREAFVRIKERDLKKMQEEGNEKGVSHRVVSETEGNIEGEIRSFKKEMEKTHEAWKDLKRKLRNVDLPGDEDE